MATTAKAFPSIAPAFSVVHGGATNANKKAPLVFLHGFLGSQMDFKRIAHHYKKHHQRDCYTVDARNHGASHKLASFTYDLQTEDLVQFMKKARLPNATFVGYSMGAKTAMNFALKYPEKVDRLVSIDNSPVNKPLGPQFQGYIDALTNTVHWAHDNYKDYDHRDFKKYITKKMMEEVGPANKLIGLYLLENIALKRGYPRSRVPLKFLHPQLLEELGEFPYHASPVQIPSLFIKAGQSDFIDDKGMEEAKRLFPDSRFETILDATHDDILVKYKGAVLNAIDLFLNEPDKVEE